MAPEAQYFFCRMGCSGLAAGVVGSGLSSRMRGTNRAR
ncbi:MAG: hypothetical protein RL385_271 [Pseudomonadota bacterium]